MLDHRIEITILVQQKMAVLDAVGGDDDVGRLADGDAALAKQAVVCGGAGSERCSEQRNDWKSGHRCFDRRSMFVVARSLQHLRQNEISDQDIGDVLGSGQLRDLGRCLTTQQRNPDR